MTFLKNDPRPCATLKQVFLDRFELVVAHFGVRVRVTELVEPVLVL